jgi:hypothetical protein
MNQPAADVLASFQAELRRLLPALAHDLKKPFSQITMSMDLLAGAQKIEDLQMMLATIRPGVEQSVADAHARLRDLTIIAAMDGAQPLPCSLEELFVRSWERWQKSVPARLAAMPLIGDWQNNPVIDAVPEIATHVFHQTLLVLLSVPRNVAEVRVQGLSVNSSEGNSVVFTVETVPGPNAPVASSSGDRDIDWGRPFADWSALRIIAAQVFAQSLGGTATFTNTKATFKLKSHC